MLEEWNVGRMKNRIGSMNKKFEVIFLTKAREFLLQLDEKTRGKIIFNIDKAKIKTDEELFNPNKSQIINLIV